MAACLAVACRHVSQPSPAPSSDTGTAKSSALFHPWVAELQSCAITYHACIMACEKSLQWRRALSGELSLGRVSTFGICMDKFRYCQPPATSHSAGCLHIEYRTMQTLNQSISINCAVALERVASRDFMSKMHAQRVDWKSNTLNVNASAC